MPELERVADSDDWRAQFYQLRFAKNLSDDEIRKYLEQVRNAIRRYPILTGPQGARGTQGPQGAAGSQGSQGASGFGGIPGPQGPQGDQGDQGDQGESPQGPTGYQGTPSNVQGDPGVPGDQGPDGFQGDPSVDPDKLAIVQADEGYVALFCSESPDVRFVDVVSAKPGRTALDPVYVEACEPGSIVAAGYTASQPAIAGIIIKDGVLELESDVDCIFTVRLSGIRKGRSGVRFPEKTAFEKSVNDRFWKRARTG